MNDRKRARAAALGINVLAITFPLAALGQVTPDAMPANSWLAIPNSKMSAVAPKMGEFAGTWGVGGPSGVIGAWGGGTLDTKRSRLIIWGGGHNDYRGNEVYVFDIKKLAWSRVTDPTPNPANCTDPNADGTPNSRHTYNGLAFIAHADRFFGSGGALNCLNGGCGAKMTWAFDFNTLRWQARSDAPTSNCGNLSSYDPATKKVYFGGTGGLFAYDYDADKWSAALNKDSFYYQTSTIDTKRGLMVVVGEGKVLAYDIGKGNYVRQQWQTTDGAAIVARSNPGVAYDSKTDRIVAWAGGPVYALNPDTKAWSAYSAPGAPAPTQTGIYGRFQYVPDVNAFIVVTSINDNVYFYKLSDGAGTLPPPSDAGAGGSDAAPRPDAPARDAGGPGQNDARQAPSDRVEPAPGSGPPDGGGGQSGKGGTGGARSGAGGGATSPEEGSGGSAAGEKNGGGGCTCQLLAAPAPPGALTGFVVGLALTVLRSRARKRNANTRL